MNLKLTKRLVDSIQPLPGKDVFVWDNELRGFGLRVFSSGRKTYFIQYRNQHNRSRRIKIGIHGIFTAEQAREKAKILLGEIAQGSDPSSEQKHIRNILTMSELAQQYLNDAKDRKRKKSYNEDQRVIYKFILPRFGTRHIQEITTLDLHTLHRELKDTSVQANRIRALLNRMFNLAIKWGLHTENPARGVEKYQEHKRTRWLNDEEVQKLLKTLYSYRNQNVANIIRLLLLTGSRKDEAMSATWDQFDLEKGVWTKPAHTTKQKKMEHLPLSPQAINLLIRMNKDRISNYLFPGKVPGKPIRDIKRAWHTILKQANLEDVHIHDLRHTYASHLVSSGLSLSIVGKLLGHTQPSTTQRYAHLADEPLRHAASIIGDKFAQLSSQ